MAAPTTTISGATNVRVAWTAADGNSAVLDAYQVWILASDGTTFAEDSVYCGGANTLTTLISNYCDIPLTALRAAPFNLAQGTQVIAKVRAHNGIGWAEFSDQSANASSAAVEVEPHAMAAPTRGAATSTT